MIRAWPIVSLLAAACMGVANDLPTPVDGAGAEDGGAGAFDAGADPDAGGADAGVVVDAGGPPLAADAAIADAGSAPVDAGAGLRDVFFLVGKQGRRALSCDEGRTWVHDTALDDALPPAQRFRCFSGTFALPDGGSSNTDCDHNAWSSTSLAFVGDAFLLTMGWGTPGTFWRSTDARTWTLVHTGPGSQDLMVGPTRIIVATRAGLRSSDRGLTWGMGRELQLSNGTNDIWNVRGGTWGGGTYVVSAQDGPNVDYQVSRDDGATWQRPQLVGGGRIDACGSSHPVYGNGVFVTATWTSSANRTTVCRSTDQGLTWTVIPGPTDFFESRVTFTGTAFMAWSNGKVHRSVDGAVWTTTNTVSRSPLGVMGPGPNLSPVAVGPGGTFVATRGGWDVWYDRQRFYRSTDGVTWDELPESAYEKGHPVTMIVAGRVPESSCR